MDKKGQLEVEVIRARGLNPKPGSRSLPGTTHTDTQTHECAHPPTHTQTDKCVCSPYPYSFLPPHLSLAAAPYVKVYLLDNGACKAKKKTKIARKTLEPLYQQALLFEESPQGKILQVIKPWSCTMCVCACVFPWPNISLSPSTGNSLGRLRATGPQMLHGSCTDPIGGAGPL